MRPYGERLLSPEEPGSLISQGLVARAKAGDNRAVEEILAACDAVIQSAARRYWRSSASREDLVAAGQRAVFEDAIPKYDAGRGVPLEAYARHWVALRLREEVYESLGIDPSLRRSLDGLRRAEGLLLQRLWREPTLEEVAREMGATVQRVRAIRDWEETARRGSFLRPQQTRGGFPHQRDPSVFLARREALSVVGRRLGPLVATGRPFLRVLALHDDPENGFCGDTTLEQMAAQLQMRVSRVRRFKERFLTDRQEHQQGSEHSGQNGCFFCDVDGALEDEGWSARDLLEAIVGD